MLKKLHSKAGMTLMEMMVSLLIMVLLVLAMGTGMNAGVRVYNDANFESNSASLAANINTALTDMLRYAQDINKPSSNDPVTTESSEFTFTNLEYGLRDAYFNIPESGSLQIMAPTADGIKSHAVVNSGSYNKLTIDKQSFFIKYYPENVTGAEITLLDGTVVPVQRGGLFYIQYTITSPDGKTRDTEAVVRLMSK